MTSKSAFVVRHIRWWHRPVPLMHRHANGEFQQVGWVWNQRAYLVNNLVHGWIAFTDQQTPENIDIWFCHHCGASLWGSKRWAIEEAIKKEVEK